VRATFVVVLLLFALYWFLDAGDPNFFRRVVLPYAGVGGALITVVIWKNDSWMRLFSGDDEKSDEPPDSE